MANAKTIGVSEAMNMINDIKSTVKDLMSVEGIQSEEVMESVSELQKMMGGITSKTETKAESEKPISLKKEEITEAPEINTNEVMTGTNEDHTSQHQNPPKDKAKANKPHKNKNSEDDDDTADSNNILDFFTYKKRTPNNDDENDYAMISEGASEWKAPEFKKENLRRSTSYTFTSLPESEQEKYVKYNLCFKDELHRKKIKPAFCDIISIIAYNVQHAIDAADLADVRSSHRIDISNSLVNSGLFLYKSSDESNISSTVEPDSYLELWIPKDVESKLITPSKFRASHRVASCYPILNGVIMSFNNMKDLLLDPSVIVSPSLAYDRGMHEKHTLLHRDVVTNNYWYQDIFMSHDVITDQYRI